MQWSAGLRVYIEVDGDEEEYFLKVGNAVLKKSKLNFTLTKIDADYREEGVG